MFTDKHEELLDRGASLKAGRSTLESLWQDVEDNFGGAAGITMQRAPGEEKVILEDSTPIHALKQFTLSLGSLLRPRGVQWARPVTGDPELADDEEVGNWLSVVGERMQRAIYATKSRFTEQASRVDCDLGRFAIGVLYTDHNRAINRLRFRAFHPRSVYVDTNDQCEVDSVWRYFNWSARQAAKFWGAGALDQEVQKELTGDSNKKSLYVHVVVPQLDAKRYGMASEKAFTGVYIDVKRKHVVEQSGYFEMPYSTPRMSVPSGSMYGYSPAMDSLPDARMLQIIGADMKDASEAQLKPPLQAFNDALVSPVNLDGITYVDPTKLQGQSRAVEKLDIAGSLPVGLENQREIRDMLFKGFHRDIMSLPDQANMTATEVIRRNEDMARVIGPMTDTLLPDYNGSVAERVFGIMLRAGQFPEPPAALEGKTIRFEYENPVSRSEQEVELAKIQDYIAFAQGVAQADPSVLDNVDLDAVVREYREVRRVSPRFQKDPKIVAQIRDARAKQMQAAQAMQAAQEAGPAAEGVDKALQVIQGGRAA